MSAMRPDPEYLKRLLTAFRDAPGPTTDIMELEKAGLSRDDPQFEFHMMLLQDEGLVEGGDSRAGGIGVDKSPDGHIQWSVIPLRLTKSGHEFAEQLGNSKILQTLKTNFLGASISTMRDAAMTIFKAEMAKHGWLC
jgi:hypothetical protein